MLPILNKEINFISIKIQLNSTRTCKKDGIILWCFIMSIELTTKEAELLDFFGKLAEE